MVEILIVGVIVVAASFFIGWRIRQMAEAKPGAHGCDNCTCASEMQQHEDADGECCSGHEPENGCNQGENDV